MNRLGQMLGLRRNKDAGKQRASETGMMTDKQKTRVGRRIDVYEYVLELKGITKIFPGVKALDQVHFQLKPGEIHALMGENGAGKSTFIKVITGVHKAEEGEMFLDGAKVDFKGPKDAQAAGIAAIYQHVTAYPHLTVTENIFMGHEKVKGGRIQWKDMHEEANALLRELNADFTATEEMGALSVAQQQMVEIAKALSMKARIIIMDEPTAALTKSESEELYRITEKLRDEGAAIIFISHRFEDMYRLATKVTVFRDSKYIGSYDVNGITNENLITAMVGREINDLFPKPVVKLGEEVLKIEDLSRTGYFKNVSFSVRKGEILGLTGLVGAGRTEVCETIFGIEKKSGGRIVLNGQEVAIDNPQDAMKLGIGYLPEDRQHQGLILDWGIGRNITLPVISQLSRHGWLDDKRERRFAKELAERVDTKAVTLFDLASSLSGGNQQKVVVAKLLASDLKVIILDEPTKGVDVGAKASIYEIMGELAKQGYAIIMVSSEMPEILGMSDRIVVMCDGRVTGELSRDEATQEMILVKAMAKSHQKSEE
nr:sugar ABC transporter ATP-binding protein [Anaerobium acetethylicum]